MSRIGGKNTAPELAVRKLLHAMGCRFRLHRRDLPGSPDIVLPAHAAVVFIHGCFWHAHEGCPKAKIPATRRAWWTAKLDANRRRDSRARRALRKLGWRVMVIWQCRIKPEERLKRRLARFLGCAQL